MQFKNVNFFGLYTNIELFGRIHRGFSFVIELMNMEQQVINRGTHTKCANTFLLNGYPLRLIHTFVSKFRPFI